jgi:hypothetical protein
MLLYNPLAIAKVWDAIMTKTPSLAPSKSEIWYFTEFRKQMDATNYSTYGKILLSLLKSEDQDHTSWWLKMAYQSETHGILASCKDSTSMDTRQIFSPRYYAIKVHDQYNKDDFSSPTIVLQNQAIPGCLQHRMRANRLTKPTLALSQIIQSGWE